MGQNLSGGEVTGRKVAGPATGDVRIPDCCSERLPTQRHCALSLHFVPLRAIKDDGICLSMYILSAIPTRTRGLGPQGPSVSRVPLWHPCPGLALTHSDQQTNIRWMTSGWILSYMLTLTRRKWKDRSSLTAVTEGEGGPGLAPGSSDAQSRCPSSPPSGLYPRGTFSPGLPPPPRGRKTTRLHQPAFHISFPVLLNVSFLSSYPDYHTLFSSCHCWSFPVERRLWEGRPFLCVHRSKW